MKILVLADLHEDSEIPDKLNPSKYDLVIIAGDLGGKTYFKKVLSLADNIYWIPGNMEELDSPEKFPEKCLHKKKLELEDGFFVVGFGFSSPTPFGTPGELTEEEIYTQLNRLPINNKTILITHSPPYGVLDEVGGGIHAGSKSIRKIMEEKKPLILLCGHIHDQEGKKKVGETTVVNVPQGSRHSGILLELNNGQIHLGEELL